MTERVTNEQALAWKALADAATPGPWTSRARDVDAARDPTIGERSGLGWNINEPPEPMLRGQFERGTDASFIASARTAVPALVDALLEARQQATAYKAALKEIKRDQGHVCEEDEVCEHESCRSSYTSWAIADKALRIEAKQ